MVVSKIYTLPVVSVWSILGTILCIWIVFQGIKHVNFWEILFPLAFICMIYDEQLVSQNLHRGRFLVQHCSAA